MPVVDLSVDYCMCKHNEMLYNKMLRESRNQPIMLKSYSHNFVQFEIS